MQATFIFFRVVCMMLCSFLMCGYGTAFASKTLIIGTMSFNPPFETLSEKNQFFGLDIEIMQAICTSLNVTCQFKALRFSEIFEQIDSGQIDVGIAAIIMNQQRAKKYSLSIPYLPSSAQFIVRNDSTLSDPAQLVGKKIGTVDAPVFVKYLSQTYGQKAIVVEHSDQALLNLAANKKIDAFFLDKLSVDYWVSDAENQLRQLGKPISMGGGYTIIARKNQRLLIQRINQALLEMNQKGRDLKIFKNYF